jgi:hypothetical protein
MPAPAGCRKGAMPPETYPDADSVSRVLDDATPLRGRTTRALAEYWQQVRAGRRWPEWRDVRLIDLWRIASCLSVLDVIEGGRDLRGRFWGTRLAEASGADITGKSMMAMPGIDADRAAVNFRHVARTGDGVLSYRRLTFIDRREHVEFEAVHLPLGPADGAVTQVISAFDFDCDVSDMLTGRGGNGA